MAKIIRLTLLIVTVLLLLAGLIGGLAAAPSKAQTALSPRPSGLGQNPPPTSTLHYKSQQGLMPPAYVLDPDAPSLLSAAAADPIPFLDPYITQTVGSWPQVIAAAELTADNRNDLAIPTGFYFDPPNDEQLHILEQSGGPFVSMQQLPAGRDPHAIVATDVNIDQRVDLVLALAGDDTLAVYTQALTNTQAVTGPEYLPLA
ncbi:MAG TPA: hypothetical protein VGD99_18775, partial [Anaerolineae bacterium]